MILELWFDLVEEYYQNRSNQFNYDPKLSLV